MRPQNMSTKHVACGKKSVKYTYKYSHLVEQEEGGIVHPPPPPEINFYFMFLHWKNIIENGLLC